MTTDFKPLETFEAQDGYNPKINHVCRNMTLEEAKALQYNDTIHVLDKNKQIRRVKVNGAPKTWKTRPMDVKVPYKYGMYEYGYLEFINGESYDPVPVVLM